MRSRIAAFILVICCGGAAPTQEEVLRSISENIDRQATGGGRVLALGAAAVGLTVLLIVLSQRRKREVAPKPLNHPGKLTREISRTMRLRPVEMRQLKQLADHEQLASPLTLLLCPSVLSRALKESPSADRNLVVGIVKKLAARESAS
jgi:hypothetical protein